MGCSPLRGASHATARHFDASMGVIPGDRGPASCCPANGAGYSAPPFPRQLNWSSPMPVPQYDVLGIGNAIVDVIARTEDDFLVRHAMNKGAMALIDEARAEAIYASMGPSMQISGGSAANTIAGVASFGARGAFVGKVKDDGLGKAFSHDIRATGVTFTTPLAADGPSTARCYVLVTPDGERTM